jgi:hypothetical protein
VQRGSQPPVHLLISLRHKPTSHNTTHAPPLSHLRCALLLHSTMSELRGSLRWHPSQTLKGQERPSSPGRHAFP